VIRSETGATALVLLTCWPFDALVPGGPLRYVVTGRASDEQGPPSVGRP
jgi:sortase A